MARDLLGFTVAAVHAHPDDEAIWTGGTLAQLSRRGAEVTVITCTLGEQGEVIGEPYQGLIADAADQLGGFRIGELHGSLSALGVQGRFLGGAGCWRDSGMVGTPSAEHPRAFVNSGDKAVEQLAEELDQLRPDLLLTYGPDGGYGHPDHIRAHHISHAAAKEVAVPRILWAVTDREDLRAGLASISRIPDGWVRAEDGELASVDKHDCYVDLSPLDVALKARAMKSHATQLWIADGQPSQTNPHAAYAQSHDEQAPYVFCLSNRIAQPILWRECYQWGSGVPITDNSDITAGL